MTEPLVTVLIPAYNPGGYLRAAVESALASEGVPFKVLVVDDGSSDGSLDTIADITDERLTIDRRENRGKSAVVNEAADTCGTPYFCVLDADDLQLPDRLAKLVREFEKHPDCGIIFSGHELILDGKRCAPLAIDKDEAACKRDIEGFRMPAHDPAAMYRTEVLREYRMEGDLRIGQGLDLILRIGENLPIRVLGEPLYSYRVHTGSTTQASREKRMGFVSEVLRRACERRGIDPETVVEPYRARMTKDYDGRLLSHLIDSAVQSRDAGRLGEAWKTALRAARLAPSSPHFLKPLIYTAVPKPVRRRIRRHGN